MHKFTALTIALLSTLAADDYTWSGEGGGYYASFTYYKGVLAGTFWGTPRYTLGLQTDALVEEDLAPQHSLHEVGEQPIPDHPPVPEPVAGASAIRRPAIRTAALPPRAKTVGATTEEKTHTIPRVIDQLVLYTEGALLDAGSVAEVESVGRQSATEINTNLRNDNLTFVVRTVAIELLPGFVESSDGYEIRDNLQRDEYLQARRIATGADTVAVITKYHTGYCGVAFVQRPGCGDNAPIPGCDMGLDHASHSLYWGSYTCLKEYGTGPHEFGHIASGEHQVGRSVPDERLAHPYCHAYAYPEGAPDGRTAVYSGGWSWELKPYYSHSQIFDNGHAVGVQGVAENGLCMEPALETMPLNSTVVFLDGFESGTTEVWSSAVNEVVR